MFMSLVGQKQELRNKFKNYLCHLELLKKSKKLEIIHLFIMLRGTKPLQESDLKLFSHFVNSFKIFFGRIPIFENPTKFNLTMIFLNL